MSFFIQEQGISSYIVYEVDPADEMDTVSLGMLTNNKIPGFAPVTFAQLDDAQYIKYNVTALKPMSRLQDETLNSKQLLGLLRSITEALLNADEYMIDLDRIILDPNYLFVDETFSKLAVICWPVVNNGWSNPDVSAFLRKLIQTMKVDHGPDDRCLPQIADYVNGTKNFSLTTFKKKLDALSHSGSFEREDQAFDHLRSTDMHQDDWNSSGLRENGNEEGLDHDGEESDAKQMSLLYLLRNFSSENAAIYARRQKEKKKQNESAAKPAKHSNVSDLGFEIPGAPNVMTNRDQAYAPQEVPVQHKQIPLPDTQMIPMPTSWGMELLNDSQEEGMPAVDRQWHKPEPHLIRIKNQEKILITKREFSLGKKLDIVDYCIADNPKVSRLHARVWHKNGVCFVADAGSLNHTYVDGEELVGMEEVRLTHGAKLCLADEEFEFREY